MKYFVNISRAIFLNLFIATLLNGCYRMPNDDEYSVVPRTNNPDLIREKPSSFNPAVNY